MPAAASAADLAQTPRHYAAAVGRHSLDRRHHVHLRLHPRRPRSRSKMKDRTVILVWPNEFGGWVGFRPARRTGFRRIVRSGTGSGKARPHPRRDRMPTAFRSCRRGSPPINLAAKLQLSPQLVESELKSYAKENPGLTAKRLDGRLVLFREGSAPLVAGAASGGADMPFIDRVKTLFARKGEVEKKIAFLSERRTALSQQLDRGYEDMGAMETKEADLRHAIQGCRQRSPPPTNHRPASATPQGHRAPPAIALGPQPADQRRQHASAQSGIAAARQSRQSPQQRRNGRRRRRGGGSAGRTSGRQRTGRIRRLRRCTAA